MAVREFLLPDLGEGLEDAEIVTWRVAAGDRVELNQTLVEDKVATPEDEQPKRRPVLVGYGVSEDERPARRPRGKGSAAGSGSEATEEVGRGRASGPVPASPPVRRLAKGLGVDLAAVTGSGPGGRVTREDVTVA